MSAFPKETIDQIAQQFRDYFHRKSGRRRLTYREARALIDYVSGPVPMPTSAGATDYSRPRISGGGRVRPTDSEIENIIRECEEEPCQWDDVFAELLRRCERDRSAEQIIYLTFRDGLSDASICDEVGVGRTTYYRRRLAILEQAGVIAVSMGVLNPWKY